MPTDLTTLAVAGVGLVGLLVWLVQVIREATQLPSEWVPVVAIAVALALIAAATYIPAPHREVIFTGLGLAAAASTSVRYVKRGAA